MSSERREAHPEPCGTAERKPEGGRSTAGGVKVAGMLNIEVNSSISAADWRAFVERHPEGTYYHLPEWQDVLKDSLRQPPFYIFARRPDSGLAGVLPLIQVKSSIKGNRLISLPFAVACGPIGDSLEAIEGMVNRAKSLTSELRCAYLELRMTSPLPVSMQLNNYFDTYVVRLSDPDSMWKKLDKRVRWVVDKSRKAGVTVRVDNTEEGLRAFYNLNLRTKRRLGVPGHSLAFFQAMRKYMDGYRAYLAEMNGQVVAGAVEIIFNGSVGYAYAASDSRYLQSYPNDAVVWQAIHGHASEGCHEFDFGKTASDNAGLAQFKKKWGAEKRPLYYYYYPREPHLMTSNRTGARYRLLTRLWSRLPLPVAHHLSNRIFRQLD